jgi:hypothetical protein
MRLKRSDREAAGVGSLAFAVLALVLSLAALVTAAQAKSHSDDAKKQINKLAASGVVSSTTRITLQEFSIVAHPGLVQAGKVTMHVENVGSITHELVIVRAASASDLPRVTTAGERSGNTDEPGHPSFPTRPKRGHIPFLAQRGIRGALKRTGICPLFDFGKKRGVPVRPCFLMLAARALRWSGSP